MIADQWPLYRLRLRTPRLELRLADPDDLSALAETAAAGVHDPAVMPFIVPWTRNEPALVARATIQWQWRTLGKWTPEDWELPLVVLVDGVVIGTQDIGAGNFAVLREVHTGSWLGRVHHGQGYGTEMRAAVLHLAFAGLGAQSATTEAFADNHASYGVSKKLGYADDGIARHVVGGEPVVGRRLRLERAGWAAAATVPVTVEGLEECREMFGVTAWAA
jgi:RimJ/RimL family protein N-acetyltransferase